MLTEAHRPRQARRNSVGCRSCRGSSTPPSACSRRNRSRGRSRPPSCCRSPRCSTRRASRASRSPAAASSTPPCAAASRAPGSASARSRAGRRRRSGLALRGRFLVGSRPVGGDFVRRFVASAAENGIDVFRLHDPLNDVSNLREAGEAIVGAGKEFHAGLVYSPGGEGAADALVEQARELAELNATRALIHDPTGGLQPHQAGELVSRVAEASGLPVGFYCQGASGSGMADSIEAARAGADLIACAVYPLALSLHRVAGESLASALAGMRLDTGVDVDRLWEASDLVDEHIGDEIVTPHAPRLAVRAAEYDLPTGLVAALDTHLRAHAAGDRLLETLEELQTIRRETGWPPLAAPIGQILASQALIHVLSARRYGTVVDEFRDLVQGRYGSPPAKVDPTVARAVTLLSDGIPLDEDPPTAEDVRQEAEGLAASEEELVLIALFGEEAEALLRTIRARATRDDFGTPTLDQSREQRIRELVRIVQESGVAEVEIEDEGMRVSVQAHRGPARARGRRRAAGRRRARRAAGAAGSRGRRDPRRVADGRRLLSRSGAGSCPPSSSSATSSRPGRRSACSRR